MFPVYRIIPDIYVSFGFMWHVLCSPIQTQHPDNNSIRVWRRTGERNHPLMTVERHQQFGGSIMFSAGVMFGRRTPLVPIEGNMTATGYENNILQPIVNGFAETVGEGFTLQDDNARPHRARCV